MNVLVIGAGGREHALVWALHKSPTVRQVFCALGNAGIAGLADCEDLNIKEVRALTHFIEEKGIGLTVIGPEAPLVDGLADELRAKGNEVVCSEVKEVKERSHEHFLFRLPESNAAKEVENCSG